jgi:predicted transport protein
MNLYTHKNHHLHPLKELPFKLEKDIQNLFEQNLTQLTGFQMVKSEFTIKSNRIDTLAFDTESKAFVIIEYKRSQHYSIIDQGVSYLNLMLEYKADFIVEYNETQKDNIKRTDVDWSQSKIIFVSPSFNDFQKKASDFKDLAIELWEVKQFANDIIIFSQIKKSKSAPSIKQVQQKENSAISKITEELKVYTEDDHLLNKSEAIKELYDTYKNALVALIDDVIIMPKKHYISFEKSKRIIVDIVVQTQEIKLYINTQYGIFKDLQNLGIQMNDKTKWGSGYYQIAIKDTQSIEYIMSLVKLVL